MEKVELTKGELIKELNRMFIYGVGYMGTAEKDINGFLKIDNKSADELLNKTVDRLLKEKSKQ
jgi:hypothetical protein